jgi:hypothetical protein
MWTQRVKIKRSFIQWLVRWACRAGTRDFCSALDALVGPVKNIFFLTMHYFNLFCPHRPASWAGSRAGSPVSYYVSLYLTVVAELRRPTYRATHFLPHTQQLSLPNTIYPLRQGSVILTVIGCNSIYEGKG